MADWQYVVSKVFHITGDNGSFVCNVTEAAPFCELLIHRNGAFLKNQQKFHSQHLAIWLCTVAKMNCMNYYLSFCNFSLYLCTSSISYLYLVCLCLCLSGERIKIVKMPAICQLAYLCLSMCLYVSVFRTKWPLTRRPIRWISFTRQYLDNV